MSKIAAYRCDYSTDRSPQCPTVTAVSLARQSGWMIRRATAGPEIHICPAHRDEVIGDD